MKDGEFDRLQDALDALSPAAIRVWSNGRRVSIDNPAFRKEGRISRKEALDIVRDHLRHRLHGICRECETESGEFYMASHELWQKALAGTYATGLLCLRCLANRLAPRPLFAEELSNGVDGAGSLPLPNDWEWTDPASGAVFQMRYRVSFPSREGPPELRCSMDFFGDGEPPEAFFDACNERAAWLWDYCREHHLDLVVNGETMLRRGEETE